MSRLVNYRGIYEKAHGAIPQGMHIHHMDGNRLNNNIANLQCVTPDEHVALHMQMDTPYKGGIEGKWMLGAAMAGRRGGKSIAAKVAAMTPEERAEYGRSWGFTSPRNTGKIYSNERKKALSEAMTDKPMWTCTCGKVMRHLAGNIKQHKKVCKAW